jgi:hypothetical protein
MSKSKNNVNPDHYKTAGREPQGQAVVHDVLQQEYAEAKARERSNEPRPPKGGAKAGARKPRQRRA